MVNGISVNMDKLTQICLTTYDAYERRRGIFREGREKFLPQWNLPTKLESAFKEDAEEYSSQVANYLFLSGSMERKARTSVNIRNCKRIWANETTRWIFDPKEVAERKEIEIREACQNFFRYTINEFPTNYHENSKTLVREYEGDSRKTIESLTADSARENLKKFKGIGRGIANLIIFYFMERGIASPIDPRNALLKVDVHKSRIPLNTDCINLNGKESVRRDLLVPILEEAYWEICDKNNLDPMILDSLLWIVGSEICRVEDYEKCVADCPIEEACISCIPEDEKKGIFLIYEKGRRVETRERAKINANVAHQGYISEVIRFIPRSPETKNKDKPKVKAITPSKDNLEQDQLSMSLGA